MEVLRNPAVRVPDPLERPSAGVARQAAPCGTPEGANLVARAFSRRNVASTRLARELQLVVVFFVVGVQRTPARATDHMDPMVVTAASDLEDLRSAEQVDDETEDLVSQLLDEPIDLSVASRSEIYQLPGLSYADVDAILAHRRNWGTPTSLDGFVWSGAITRAQARQIKPFVTLGEPSRHAKLATGRLRARIGYSPADPLPPTGSLEIRLRTPLRLDMGGTLVTTRRRLGRPAWSSARLDDMGRRTLVADGPTQRVHLPKYFVAMSRPSWRALLGTYQIGFAERVTFDTTTRSAPRGFYPDTATRTQLDFALSCRESPGPGGSGFVSAPPCPGQQQNARALTDFEWQDGLSGLAVQLAPAGSSPFGLRDALTLWVSFSRPDIYQYDLVPTQYCADARRNDERCASPWVARRTEDPSTPTSRFRQHSLPRLMTERVVGANLTTHLGKSWRVGITGYGASVSWHPEAGGLDFQDSARRPFGGPYGAIGADVGWERHRLALAAEAARSFDSMPSGGGLGVLARAVVASDSQSLDLTARYYSPTFANPYAGSTAAPDEVEGQRARDEWGTRWQHTVHWGAAFVLRSRVDLWAPTTTGIPHATVSWRLVRRANAQLRPGLELRFASKDLRRLSWSDCYSGTSSETARPCGGEKLATLPRVGVHVGQRLDLEAQYQHEWLADHEGAPRPRQDAQVRVNATFRVREHTTLRARLRWLMEDVLDDHHLEQSLWGYVRLACPLSGAVRLTLRYDLKGYLDARQSTRARTPHPEHWGQATIEAGM